MKVFFCIFLLFLVCLPIHGKIREYYIAAVEVLWDYAPTGRDMVSVSQGEANLENPRNMKHVYKKAVYQQYTNDSFHTEIAKPPWLGYIGPILAAEYGDTIIVHFRNLASKPFSISPHRVSYPNKYQAVQVMPDANYTYQWLADLEPEMDDCSTSFYHSAVNRRKDINSGLLGIMIICKKGKLETNVTRIALHVGVIDENASWYREDNRKEEKVDQQNVNHQDNNRMYAMNGFVYGNLPGLDMCLHDRLVWHMAAIAGDSRDVYAVTVHGHSFLQEKHRLEAIALLPGETSTADMYVTEAGKWLITCLTNDHYTGGMQAFLKVTRCNKQRPVIDVTGRIRQYFIAAEEVIWNYSTQANIMDLDDTGYESSRPNAMNTTKTGGAGQYKKAMFREYTDAKFLGVKSRTSEDMYLGLLGPVIRAEVGDTVKVVFYNKATKPLSLHPYGLQYNKYNEGSLYQDGTTAFQHRDDICMVASGHIFVYYWTVPSYIGPGTNDENCIVRAYVSNVNHVRDMNSGLVGPILVCKQGCLTADGKQIGVHTDIFVAPLVIDENESWYFEENFKHTAAATNDSSRNAVDLKESNRIHSINGFSYNTPSPVVCMYHNVTWHFLSLGSSSDIHSLYFHGNEFLSHDEIVTVQPGIFKSYRMIPSKEGVWKIVDLVRRKYKAGIESQYIVKDCGKTPAETKPSRRPVSPRRRNDDIYIAAEEKEWDYYPSKSGDKCNSKFIKAVFRQYTDKTFSRQKRRNPYGSQDMGLLGPIIRVESGRNHRIVFKNKASRPYSLHFQGLASSVQQTNNGNVVQPGQTYDYVLKIPDIVPLKSDKLCITRSYYSNVNPGRDINSGLIGPLIICKESSLRRGERRDDEVDGEVALLFNDYDEKESWYLQNNTEKYCSGTTKSSALYTSSTYFKTINGFTDVNVPNVGSFMVDEVVDWYLLAMGNSIRSIHLHGRRFNAFSEASPAIESLQLFPGTSRTLRMRAEAVGDWFLHSQLNDEMTEPLVNYTIYSDVDLNPS